MRTLVALLLPLLLAGCKNPCQALCNEIADFAKRECGLEFSDAEVSTCIADHAGSNLAEGERGVCRDGRGDVEDEWDCDEIAVYFEGEVGGGTGTSGGDTGQ